MPRPRLGRQLRGIGEGRHLRRGDERRRLHLAHAGGGDGGQDAVALRFRHARRRLVEQQRAQGDLPKLVGLVLEGKGVLRAHMRVVIPGADGAVAGEGETTSGTFSPTLEKAIAFARIPVTDSTEALVDIRGKLQPARIVKPVFARSGKPLI